MSHHTLSLVAVIAVVFPLAWFLGRRVGVGASFVWALATAVFVDVAVPHFPHSPVACALNNHPGACTGPHQATWAMGLFILAPLGVGLIYKEILHLGQRSRAR